MLRAIIAPLLAVLIALPPMQAEAAERTTLGWPRLFNNDFLGEARDRWRTGSYWVSMVRGPGWNGVRPEQAGAIIEYRFRGEIITPANLTTPDPSDRPYVGALSFGAHTHFRWRNLDVSAGADLVFTGSQTGLGKFQRSAHKIFGAPEPEILDDQIPNGIYPTALVELGQSVSLSDRLLWRPFIEAQAGVETFVRIGGDFHFGQAGQVDLFVRDVVTGHRVPVTQAGPIGLSLVAGGDVAYVASSAYLPSSDGYDVTSPRWRARAGLLWQWDGTQIFYGVTYLGKEFDAQDEGQVVGSLHAKVRF
ncbi:MAG: lipid A-modifier LpxR family protein [Pseudomonadota bacterium]